MEKASFQRYEFAALRATIMKEVPEGILREEALRKIARLNPDISTPEASERETLKKGRVDETAYRSALAKELKSLACSGDENAPYIVRGLIAGGSRSRIAATGAQAPILVAAILSKDCPVSAALTDADKAALKEIAKEASGRTLTLRLPPLLYQPP